MPAEFERLRRYDVFVRENWGSQWEHQPHLICTSVDLFISEQIDRANFLWRCGEVRNPEDKFGPDGQPIPDGVFEEPTEQNHTPLEYEGWYVRVKSRPFPDEGVSHTEQFDWVGVFVTDLRDRGGGEMEVGTNTWHLAYQDQHLSAVGMEWFLTRAQVTTSRVWSSKSQPDTIGRGKGFNLGQGAGRTTDTSPKGNKDLRTMRGTYPWGDANGTDNPVYSPDIVNSTLWNGFDAVRYLLTYHTPKDRQGIPAPVRFAIENDSKPFLEWITPVLETEGRTVMQLLTDIIDNRRTLLWYLVYDQDGDGDGVDRMIMKVTSANPDDVRVGNVTIPRARIIRDKLLGADVTTTVDRFEVGRDLTRRYDSIRVRGALRTGTGTVGFGDGNLIKNWTDALEDEYKEAAGSGNAAQNDTHRKDEKFATVYTAWTVPENWDGKTGDGFGGSKDFVCPQLDGNSNDSIGESEPFSVNSIRILRTLPLLVGFDYTNGGNPVPPTGVNVEPEKLKPWSMCTYGSIRVPLQSAGGRKDPNAGQGSAGRRVLKTSYNLRVADSSPSMINDPSSGLPHNLGEGHFDPKTDSRTAYRPELNFENAAATVCFEWDVYVEGVYPESLPNVFPVHELVIYAGDRYRLDWLANNTVLSIDEDGSLVKCTAAGPVRDDRDSLFDIARLAYEYYAIERRTMSLDVNYIFNATMGTLIIQAGGVPAQEDNIILNTSVTHIRWMPEAGKTLTETGYFDLVWRRVL